MRNWSMVIMVRSAFGDREYSSILLATGSPTAVGKPAAIQSWIRLGGSYFQTSKTDIFNNFEKSIFSQIVSNKDPPRRTSPPWWIKPCIAPGLPAVVGEPGGNDYSIAHNPWQRVDLPRQVYLQQEFFFKGNPMIFQKPFVFIKKGHFFMVLLLILHVLD